MLQHTPQTDNYYTKIHCSVLCRMALRKHTTLPKVNRTISEHLEALHTPDEQIR